VYDVSRSSGSVESQPTFRGNMFCLLPAFTLVFLLGLFFVREDGGDMFLRNVGWLSTDYMPLYPMRQNTSQPPLWELQSWMNFHRSALYRPTLRSLNLNEQYFKIQLLPRRKKKLHVNYNDIGRCSSRKASLCALRSIRETLIHSRIVCFTSETCCT
jgi:hypothetical protein